MKTKFHQTAFCTLRWISNLRLCFDMHFHHMTHLSYISAEINGKKGITLYVLRFQDWLRRLFRFAIWNPFPYKIVGYQFNMWPGGSHSIPSKVPGLMFSTTRSFNGDRTNARVPLNIVPNYSSNEVECGLGHWVIIGLRPRCVCVVENRNIFYCALFVFLWLNSEHLQLFM